MLYSLACKCVQVNVTKWEVRCHFGDGIVPATAQHVPNWEHTRDVTIRTQNHPREPSRAIMISCTVPAFNSPGVQSRANSAGTVELQLFESNVKLPLQKLVFKYNDFALPLNSSTSAPTMLPWLQACDKCASEFPDVCIMDCAMTWQGTSCT